jgi:hypothetical protein
VLDGDLPCLVVFVGRQLTMRTGVTMRALRHSRKLWVFRAGLASGHGLSEKEVLVAARLLERRPIGPRGP